LTLPGKVVPIAFIEGLAAIGGIREFRVEDCGVPKRKRVVVLTSSGEILVSRCMDERGIKRAVMVLAEFKNRLSKLLVEGER
jgi:hypothetical protein